MYEIVADQPALIPAPDDPAQWAAWRDGISKWKQDARTEQRYSDAAYVNPEFAWMQSCFSFGKVMLFDREWVDPQSGEMMVEKWLDQREREFGGLDALALWQAYPRIGIDRRNQYDHYRDLPKGPDQLRDVVERLQKRHVRVFLAYNPWDTGTRSEGKSDLEALAEMVSFAQFDGIFLDTLTDGGRAMRPAIDTARAGVVLESELALPVAAIPDHHASWAQWLPDSHAPGVLRNRWFEQRHMMHMIRRWDKDHSGELHTAWMNGAGIFIWENIFGSWNGWTDRDKSLLKSIRQIQKRFAKHFSHGIWTPLVETSLPDRIFASKWEIAGSQLWTVVNRANNPEKAFIQRLTSDGTHRLFDLVRGEELDHSEIELMPRGLGCIVSLPNKRVDNDFDKFLAEQREGFARLSFSPSRVDPMVIRLPQVHSGLSKPGQVMKSLEAGIYKVVSRMRVRECGDYEPGRFGDQSYPGLHSHRLISRTVELGRFAVAEREVTNSQFHRFVKESNYRPKQDRFFLAHWKDGMVPAGQENAPVVFVSWQDAQAYAHWAKLRLPTEEEWQLAVEKHSLAHGVVWNWTDSRHSDGQTEFSVLKGGCEWRAIGSDWYADSGYQPADWSLKFLHFWPGIDRSETIGFRCAVSLE